MLLMLGLIVIGVIMARASIPTFNETKESLAVPQQQILCYREDANTCVDYKGVHAETCATGTSINHWWCHENYCIFMEKSCQGGGTNVCSATPQEKCIFRA
jgi:hypothetical protein